MPATPDTLVLGAGGVIVGWRDPASPRRARAPRQRRDRVEGPPAPLSTPRRRAVVPGPQLVQLPDAVTVPVRPVACPRCHAQVLRDWPPEVSCVACGWAVVWLEPVR